MILGKDDLSAFFETYSELASSDALAEKYTKEPEGKSCRFCGLAYPEVSFNTLPHIVPELFGRNSTSSNFECDACNSTFQKYESDASTFVQHYLSILNIKSKKGVPNFRSKKKGDGNATSIIRKSSEMRIMFGGNLSDFEYDYEKKTITLHLRTRNFSPFSIYKVLLKIGISLMSREELADNPHFLEFLNSDVPIDNGMQVWSASRYMLRTRYYEKPICKLYKAKTTLIGDKAYPEFVLVLFFANIVLQMCLPISDKNCHEHKKTNRLLFELFPSFVLDDPGGLKSIEMFRFDMKETAKISITDSIELYFDRLDKGQRSL